MFSTVQPSTQRFLFQQESFQVFPLLKRTMARPGYQTADSWQKHLILDFGTQLTNTFVFVTYLSFDGAIYSFMRMIFYFGQCLDMSHCQMLGKFEYGLPAKF